VPIHHLVIRDSDSDSYDIHGDGNRGNPDFSGSDRFTFYLYRDKQSLWGLYLLFQHGSLVLYDDQPDN